MTGRFKCLVCRNVISDKYMHTRRTNPPHKQFIEISGEGEELSPTTKWTQELMSDELAGQKKISIKISTHEAITEISTKQSGATYDDIILAALSSYKREKEIGPETLESIAYEETEDE